MRSPTPRQGASSRPSAPFSRSSTAPAALRSRDTRPSRTGGSPSAASSFDRTDRRASRSSATARPGTPRGSAAKPARTFAAACRPASSSFKMRVLVTRPREQAERTAERLGALGHEPFVAPLLTIVPTQEPPPPAPFAAFVVTSAHAIPALASLGDAARQAPVLAVGERTAALARQAGLRQAQTAEG